MDKFSNAHESDSDLDKIDWCNAEFIFLFRRFIGDIEFAHEQPFDIVDAEDLGHYSRPDDIEEQEQEYHRTETDCHVFMQGINKQST